MKLKIILLLGILVILLPDALKAQYNDPGSMSFIFQFLLIIFAFIVFYFQKIRLFIVRVWNKLFGKDIPK
ncbi:MAG: hypothetical protein NTX44_12730 [Ignavibacteriales bacterium]|nr:hypothetical protein [Ignavibacteriales bacterium]